MPRTSRLTEAQFEQIIELYRLKYTLTQIAKMFNITPQYVKYLTIRLEQYSDEEVLHRLEAVI